MSVQIGIALMAFAGGVIIGVTLAIHRRPAQVPHDAVSLARLEGQLQTQAAELRRMADATAGSDLVAERLRAGVESTRRVLEQLQVRDQERRANDLEHRRVIGRLSTVLAGGAAQGRAGENVLREHLAQLPPGMLITDLRVGGKVVEFGLVLPDGRRLPVDSKWTAVAELEALEAAEEPADLEACARAVEKAVAMRAREVSQYLDPAVTAPVAVAAVPDAAYAVLKRAHADAFARGVVIVPFGSALPILLFLYTLVQRFGDAIDIHTCLAEIGGSLDLMDSVVENKFARAGTMITNGAEEFRSQLGQARGSIARARRVPAQDGDRDDVLSVVR